MPQARVAIQPLADPQPIGCQVCGRPSLRVAEMLNANQTAVGRTMVCTNCWGSHHRQGE